MNFPMVSLQHPQRPNKKLPLSNASRPAAPSPDRGKTRSGAAPHEEGAAWQQGGSCCRTYMLSIGIYHDITICLHSHDIQYLQGM